MKHLLLAFTLSAALSSPAQWIEKSSLPSSERIGAMSFTSNNYIFIVGGMKKSGSTYQAFRDIWAYDPSKNSWDSVGLYPGGNIYGGVCFVKDGKAYIGLGGNENGVLSNKFYCWDLASNTWTQKANFPGITRIYPFYNSISGKHYLGSGVGLPGGVQTMLSDFWEYDEGSNTWTQKDPYPGGGSVGLASFSLNGKIYAGLGDDGFNFYNDFYEYDPQLNSWNTRASFNGQNKSFPSCVSSGQHGFMLGGEMAHLVYTNDFWRYDAVSNQWKKSTMGFSGAARRYGAFHLINGKFYYGLGQTGMTDEEAINDMWEGSNPLSVQATPVAGISIYPNPVSDGHIRFSKLSTGKLEVYNTLGTLVLETKIENSGADVSVLRQGIYFISVDGVATARLVIQ